MTKTSRRIWIAGLVLAALIALFAVNAGRILVVDAPQPADVIVVLAGETEQRPKKGLALLDQGLARRVVIDVPAEARIYELTQVQIAERYIQNLPESGSVRVCPIEGLSTRDEAHDVEKCLAGEKADRILIVTSEYHTRRALSIFRHEIHGKSFSVAAAYGDTEFGVQWWRRREWAKTCLYEWMRLSWWVGVDRWR